MTQTYKKETGQLFDFKLNNNGETTNIANEAANPPIAVPSVPPSIRYGMQKNIKVTKEPTTIRNIIVLFVRLSVLKRMKLCSTNLPMRTPRIMLQ